MGGQDNIVKLLKLLMKLNLIRSYWFCVHTHSDEQQRSRTAVKLLKSDGSTEIYHRPIPVSDLTKQFPRHMVCRSDSFFIGQKIPALSETDRLLPGYNYFLLPKHLSQSVLSFVTIASFASSLSQNDGKSKDLLDLRNGLIKRPSMNCQPFHVQKGPSGGLRIRVSDEFIAQLITGREIVDDKPMGKVCTTAQLQKDYTQLVGSRQWKPKLETIREKTVDNSRRKLYSSFGMKRRKKRHHQLKYDHQKIVNQRLSSTNQCHKIK